MENMEIWNKVKQPPKSALRTIGAGRLKGKSDINPMWRIEALTSLYGPCGDGWGYTIDKLWTEPGDGVEVMAFALVTLWYHNIDGGLCKVPGIGGSMLIASESKGAHNSDEAYKMAVTDALSVACKALGFGADVYHGRWDGSKYATGEAAIPAPKVVSPVDLATARAESKSIMDWLTVCPQSEIPTLVRQDDCVSKMNFIKSVDEALYNETKNHIANKIREVKAQEQK
jgi:hypothetical protein